MNIAKMMKQAQQMQKKMGEMQEGLASSTATMWNCSKTSSLAE